MDERRRYTFKDYVESSIEMDLRRLEHFEKIKRGIRTTGRLKCRVTTNGRNNNGRNNNGRSNKERLRDERLGNDRIKDNGFEIVQSENPYRREELTKVTTFGLYVRSKSEQEIAELLYSMGIQFYYEKGLELWSGEDEYGARIFYPDFTIPLPNGRVIYWEHKGLMSDYAYIKRDIEREIVYNLNGIYQPHNLIVTEEGANNELDMEAVKRMVSGVILPMLAA